MSEPTNTTDGELIDVSRIARLLDVSTRTVWRMVRRGELHEPFKVGGGTRWRRVEIDRWLDAGCPAASESAEGTGQ